VAPSQISSRLLDKEGYQNASGASPAESALAVGNAPLPL